MKRFVTSLAIAASIAACSGGNGSDSPATPAAQASWTQLGPPGGFIPAIQYHPTNAAEVWLSGDDSSGLFKSTDFGQTWRRINSVPQNHSSYVLRFDPSTPSIVYAPHRFGAGMLKTTNSGSSWTRSQSGLPQADGSTDTVWLNDLALKPGNSNTMIAATGQGLFRSVDSGANFSLLSGFAGQFYAVVYAAGVLYAGNAAGAVKFSINDGNTWSDLFPPGSVPVARLVVSNSALYVLFATGDLYFVTIRGVFSVGQISSSADRCSNHISMGLAVVSGAAQGSDTIYLGMSGNSGSSCAWGLFKSVNGGSTWSALTIGLAGISPQTIAVDPFDATRLLLGSVNSAGVYRSTDAGASWSAANTGLFANAAIAFAQNPSNPSHLLLSSSAAGGFSRTFQSIDGGVNWSTVAEVNDRDGTFYFDIDPSDQDGILAGTKTKGLYLSINGVGGPWARVIAQDVFIDQIRRDAVNSSTIYALATAPNSAVTRLYVSIDNGENFSIRNAVFATHIAVHPARESEAVITSINDAFASTDLMGSVQSLALAAFAPGQTFTAAAFDAASPTTLLVGDARGGLYKTTNYTASGAGVAWTRLSSPFRDARVRDIVIRSIDGTTYYFAAAIAEDVRFTSNSIAGLYVSQDGGVTWTSLRSDSSQFATTNIFRLIPSISSSSEIFVAGWGAGVAKLVYR